MFHPAFLRGAIVLMTGSCIARLLGGFQVTPFIPFDDVYLSGLVASKAAVPIFTNEWYSNIAQ